MRSVRLAQPLVLLSIVGLCACEADLGPRPAPPGSSFGAIVYREACQRVAYTTDLQARRDHPDLPLDASGATHRALCTGRAQPSEGTAPALRALAERRSELIRAVDAMAPEGLLGSLDGYLRALRPLQDDGTVSELLGRTGRLLEQLAADQALTSALARLGRASGIQPPGAAGGIPRAVALAPALDDALGALLPLLLPGGGARREMEALARALAFELRHLERAPDPLDPERPTALLRDLLLRSHDELASGQTVLLALRDPRGMPLLADIVPPYVRDDLTGLARTDGEGRFVDARGAPIPYVPPLPELGKQDSVRRDAQGRALRPDGQPLYRYADLDRSLLLALLRDAHRLLPDRTQSGDEVNIPLGLLRGVALLSGSRNPVARIERSGEVLQYAGFRDGDAVLLDLAHALLQLLRLPGQGEPGQDLIDALGALRALLGTPAHEPLLSRSVKALLDAADQARQPAYSNARIPSDSTLFDDLAPVLARLVAVPPRTVGDRSVTLLEDLIAALQDPHVRGLGPMIAQLMEERGYFFMKQPRAASDLSGGYLLPQGVVGTFGHRPDRSRPDADATLDWRAERTSDPANNRSVFQRLLHLLADTNGGRPFCNGRNAALFGGFVLFRQECDLFRVDNVARFFLLSIASRPLREDPRTFARHSASFLEAIRNSNNCRCVPGDPDPRKACADPEAKRKCDALLMNIPDNDRGDDLLQGMMGIRGFGRYPEPPAAARSLFLDLGDATSKPPFSPQQPRDLLFNHVVHMDGTLRVDPTDPDNRKIRDGAGQLRLAIEEYNGVLFALEVVRGPAVFADGTPNPFPEDTFYDALRPLVDAFARHYECFERDRSGVCIRGQNAVQILADALTVLHRHWPSIRSQRLGRSFADSYGPHVRPDGAVSYEPLLAHLLLGDLPLSASALAPVLSSLTVDGRAEGRPALPVLARLLRYVFDPSQAPPGGLALRDGRRTVHRHDGTPAYADATLAQVLGAPQDGRPTPYYLLVEALRRKQAIFDLPAHRVARDRWDRAVSDALDALLQVRVEPSAMGPRHRFDNPRLRPVAVLLLDFVRGRLQAHRTDLAGWSQQLLGDLAEVLRGPLYAALVDLGVRLDEHDEARRLSYALLRQVLDDKSGGLVPLAVSAADAVQLLLDDHDLVDLGRALSPALDLSSGPMDPALVLARRGRELERDSPDIPERPVLIRLLRGAFAPEPDATYPAFWLGQVLAEVNRATPGQGGDYTAADHRALLATSGRFLLDQQRGLPRLVALVQERLLR